MCPIQDFPTRISLSRIGHFVHRLRNLDNNRNSDRGNRVHNIWIDALKYRARIISRFLSEIPLKKKKKRISILNSESSVDWKKKEKNWKTFSAKKTWSGITLPGKTFARSDEVKGMENNASFPRHGLLTGSFVLTNGTSGERLAREGGCGGEEG